MKPYGFKEHLERICLPPAPADVLEAAVSADLSSVPTDAPYFACNWDQMIGLSPGVVEGYFLVLTAGFDVLEVEERTEAGGILHVKHARRFLGWAPTDQLIDIPFTFEAFESPRDPTKIAKVFYQSDTVARLTEAGCPQEVTSCLANIDSVNMFVGLRRALVRPDLITHRALNSANKKVEKWQSALGVL